MDRVFNFEEGPRLTPKAIRKDLSEDEGSKDFGGFLMIWSRKQLVGPRMAPDVVNPRTLRVGGCKEDLGRVVFDIRLMK